MQLVNSHDADAAQLAELGYKQEFDRKWNGFQNFAISFSIISILSGCFTTFGQAWANGGPVAISIGWPVIASLIMIIALCMAELVSAMPTAGGIYYWALKLGKPIHGWMTGWLNLIGLVAVTAAVDYGFALFFVTAMNMYSSGFNPSDLSNLYPTDLNQIFTVFVITIILHVLINIYGAKVIHKLQTINVYWHVGGVAAIILILVLIPTEHQTISWMFTERINLNGMNGGTTEGLGYWFYVLPLGFLLTQYTITGFDASAHVSEETGQAGKAAAQGLWKAVAYSAVAGWVLLLAFLYASTNVDAMNEWFGFSPIIFITSLPVVWAKLIMVLTLVGQFFCGMSCVTAASRMCFAFSRDEAVPGHKYWRKLDKNRNPSNAALFVGVFATVLTLPALIKVEERVAPLAFYAVTSVAVIGLFAGFAIPIWLRFKAGDSFKTGQWNLGKHYKWMAPVAVLEIIIVSIYFVLPVVPTANWFSPDFDLRDANYSPIALIVVIGGAYIWWLAGAKKTFRGAHRTIDER
jgi:amino acid transporter